MAKDGTARGGARAGSGRKSKALKEKLDSGNPGGRKLTVMELPADSDLSGEDMPEPKSYMLDRQKNGGDLDAEDVFRETWLWLKERGCERLVNPRLIEAYAQAFARYIQCEEATSTYGLLGKHPTTGGVITSPFVQMSQPYQKSANLIWYEIYGIVKENCTVPFEDNPNDTMELLLRRKRGN